MNGTDPKDWIRMMPRNKLHKWKWTSKCAVPVVADSPPPLLSKATIRPYYLDLRKSQVVSLITHAWITLKEMEFFHFGSDRS